ncbi:SETMAR [Cordylochernes scorpioides]|uniref:SETMAR n=1 Tax=Cordylochernes scorpioides TaxID=51811 RepID=A0ABY6LQM6_9ARAC|nr:SETMAR [Cordylochernes scorpioides]
MKEQYDRNSKSYSKVNVGEDAWCQMHPRETWTPVKISAQADSPRSFEVVTPSGNRLIRNQQFIRPRDGVNEKRQLSSEPITGSPEAQHPHYDSQTMGESSTAPIRRSSEETNIDQREGATTSAGISPEPSGRPRFSSGDFELDNEQRGKPPQKFEDAELQALLDEDSTQPQEKLAKQLQVSQGAVSLRLNSLGMTQKLSRWVPHELSERQQERRLVTCGGLLARHEKKSFLHRIVTSDEKWIHFSNPMRQKSWGLPSQFPKQTPRPNRFGKKAMLCVWWDQNGVVYFELLKPGETVNTSRYEQQMLSLREALNEKKTGMA